jgi:energy-coupling factor transporter ATP-binding protein EcfA2
MAEESQEIRLKEQRESSRDYPPAYFLSIELEDVLCFKIRQTLDLSDANGFPSQWTVILGDNGVGKTTLLRSLAAMEPYYINFNQPLDTYLKNSHRRSLPPSSEWRNEFDQHLSFDLNLITRATALYAYGSPLSSFNKFSLSKSAKRPTFEQATLADGYGLSTEFLSLNCYGYGANRRISETSISEAFSSDSCASLFSDKETLINAEEWLLQADYAVARSAPDNTARLEKRLHLIQDILKQLLPDIADIHISPASYYNPLPAAEFLTPYGWVPLKSLSLGYKTVIAWTVDLAARLIDRYPRSEDPLAEPAVVLVDEIDLHLHPKWQRTIMSFLSDRFPNTQFIVTAHSPLVVQAAGNANIVLLRREGDHVVIDNDPEIIDNWRVEQVLASVFELPSPHSPEIEPLIERRRKLLAKSKLTAKDERELKKLEEQIGTIPTAESPEDIRAMDIIRKAAKLLENS